MKEGVYIDMAGNLWEFGKDVFREGQYFRRIDFQMTSGGGFYYETFTVCLAGMEYLGEL